MRSNILSVCLFVFSAFPFLGFAASAEFTPMVGIPGVGDSGDFNAYVNALYALSISLAALLAVIKIIIAGVKYMMSDVVPNKESAKDDIKGALVGLLIIISAVLVLETINPSLTNFDILSNADPTRQAGNPQASNGRFNVVGEFNKDEEFLVPCREDDCRYARGSCQLGEITGMSSNSGQPRDIEVQEEGNFIACRPVDSIEVTFSSTEDLDSTEVRINSSNSININELREEGRLVGYYDADAALTLQETRERVNEACQDVTNGNGTISYYQAFNNQGQFRFFCIGE